jgi:hypothetical protein
MFAMGRKRAFGLPGEKPFRCRASAGMSLAVYRAGLILLPFCADRRAAIAAVQRRCNKQGAKPL